MLPPDNGRVRSQLGVRGMGMPHARRAADDTVKERTDVSHRTVRGRLALTSLLSAVALLAIALPSGATTNPEEVGGNPTCADLGYGQGYGAFKIDPPRSGDFTSPDGKLTVTLAVSGKSLGFTTNIPVAAVIVKGGNAANVYRYGSGSTGDSGLYAPDNASGGPADLSHVDFCYKPQTPPPPPDCTANPKPAGCEQPPPPDCSANPKPAGCEQPPPPDCTANAKPEGCPKPPPPPVNPPPAPPGCRCPAVARGAARSSGSPGARCAR